MDKEQTTFSQVSIGDTPIALKACSTFQSTSLKPSQGHCRFNTESIKPWRQSLDWTLKRAHVENCGILFSCFPLDSQGSIIIIIIISISIIIISISITI